MNFVSFCNPSFEKEFWGDWMVSLSFSTIIEKVDSYYSHILPIKSVFMLGLDHFGIIAPWYDRVMPFAKKQQLVSMAKLPVDGKLLDLGGGTGRVAQSLESEVSMLVVADASARMLRQTAGKTGLHPVHTWAERLPFSAEFFDRVIMVDAFHHLVDQEGVAREMWRVLRPQGRIVIEEPDIRTWGARVIAVFEKILLMRSHFISPPRIGRLFTDSRANVHILEEYGTAWVMIDKVG
jgi:ubiquinone/menaquinone biosynthesis C-methylase UbiE